MATNSIISDLVTLSKTSVDNYDFFELYNSATNLSKKITISTLFPSLATTGSSSEDIWISVTNKNQLNFKGIKSGDTDLLTVATTSNNIVLTALEAGIDLSLCNNDTSEFVTGVDFTGTVTGECPVSKGGTSLSTIAKGALLYASAADTIAATTAMSTNGQLLIGNATNGYPSVTTLTAGSSNVTITNGAGSITIDASLSTMAAILDMANYNIDLGTGYISADGSTSQGLRVTGAHAYVGASGAYHDTDILNIGGGGISFSNTAAVTIKPNSTSGSTAGQNLTLEAGGSVNGAGGNLSLKAGTTTGSGNGGKIQVYGGDESSGTPGQIEHYTYDASGSAVRALTITAGSGRQDVTADNGHLVIGTATKGLVHTGATTATQATDHTTGVTINATVGVITLAAVALAATTNAQFIFTNSTITTSSIILLTMEDANTTNNAQLACALVSRSSGSCIISVVNPHSSGATSATASKIHFLVINNSV